VDELNDLEDIQAGWHYWRGVSGLFYARRVRSSPPVVLRAGNLDELRALVREHIKSREAAR
jgi:hypothetical protein